MRIMEKFASNMQKFYAVCVENGLPYEDYEYKYICYFRTYDEAKRVCDALKEELKHDSDIIDEDDEDSDTNGSPNDSQIREIYDYWRNFVSFFYLSDLNIFVEEVNLCICEKENDHENEEIGFDRYLLMQHERFERESKELTDMFYKTENALKKFKDHLPKEEIPIFDPSTISPASNIEFLNGLANYLTENYGDYFKDKVYYINDPVPSIVNYYLNDGAEVIWEYIRNKKEKNKNQDAFICKGELL